jgi:Ca2+-binding EF-hand superfamily protein
MKAFPPVLPTRTQSMAGPGQTNWVIKGHVLCGGHPGSNPSDMVKNLKAVLEAGVTTFVCLQHDMIAPNITLAGASVTSRSRSAFGDGVVVRAKPYIQDAQLIAERAGMPQVTPDRPLTFLHLPIPDTSGATVPDAVLSDFVLMLLAHIKAGELLYVQCSDGNGRTGMVCALLLGLVYHLSSSEALDLTQRYREHRAGTSGLSPESHEQKMVVHRLLSHDSFRSAGDGMAPAGPGSMLPGDVLSAVMLNVKQQLNDKGQVSFIRLVEAARASLSRNITCATMPQVFAWLSTEGIRLTDDELSVLVSAFPAPSGRNVMNVEAFTDALRGELPLPRRDVVFQAFRCLPLSAAGDIDVSALAKLHNARNHPQVKSGRRSDREVADEFLRTIRPRGGRTGKVSLREFQEYYTDVSASILDDNAFQLLLWSVWPLKSKASDDAAGVASVGGSTALPMPQTASKELALEDALSAIRRAGQHVGEWAFPKLKLGLLTADKNGDGRVTISEFEEALGFARFIFAKVELGDVFRALGPQGNSVPIDLILSVAQVGPCLFVGFDLLVVMLCCDYAAASGTVVVVSASFGRGGIFWVRHARCWLRVNGSRSIIVSCTEASDCVSKSSLGD